MPVPQGFLAFSMGHRGTLCNVSWRRVQWAPGIPHALQGGEKFSNDSGATRREIAKPYFMNTNAPHSQPSSPATGLAEGETRWRGITVLDAAGVTLFPGFRVRHPPLRSASLLLRLVDRQDLQRRGVGFDAERLVCDQADLAQRRLFEVAGIGLAYRILPDTHRALADQHFGDPAGVLAFDLGEFVAGKPDHDFVLGGDDLEKGHFVGGKGWLIHNALHDEAGKADTE